MPRIVFLRREVHETEGPNRGPVFEEGERVDCVQDFADRWTQRGAAEETGPGEPKDGERWTRVPARAKAKPVSEGAADGDKAAGGQGDAGNGADGAGDADKAATPKPDAAATTNTATPKTAAAAKAETAPKGAAKKKA